MEAQARSTHFSDDFCVLGAFNARAFHNATCPTLRVFRWNSPPLMKVSKYFPESPNARSYHGHARSHRLCRYKPKAFAVGGHKQPTGGSVKLIDVLEKSGQGNDVV